MDGLTPKQRVLILLDQCLATGVKGRVAEIVRRARDEVDQRSDFSDSYFANAAADVSDPRYPGLVFKVGKRSRRWIYRYTPRGQRSTKQLTLGHFPTMTAAEARLAWQRQREPDGQDRAEIEVSTVALSIAELINRYRHYAKQFRPDWRREMALLEQHLGDRFGQWDALALSQTEVSQLLTMAQQQAQQRGGHGQGAKEKLLAVIRHLYDVARGISDYQDSSLPWLDRQHANPTEGLSVSRPTPMRIPLFASDVGRYLKALTGLPLNEDVKALLQLQVSSAAPFSMLCRLQWQQIDWQQRLIRFQQANGSVVWQPLSQQALQMLDLRRRQQRQSSVWVFTAISQQHKPMPLRYPSQLLASLREHLQLPSHFTATALVRFALEWHRQQGGGIGQVGLPVSDSHIKLIPASSLTDGAEQWQQYLSNLRHFG
ncbi:integrase family protein [Ferrimonas senticii]|uniref:integrase family protein n=1 Tax=Ferrimonas senticii TaxID=394566 RepID=UPI00041237EF|nr:integrase family protein [Ferrimonas senticii]